MKASHHSKKWIVLKHTQLTSLQEYVYCKDEYTANYVAKRFHDDPKSTDTFSWVNQVDKGVLKEHWCVVQDTKWAIACSAEIRHGQWYIGVWDKLSIESIYIALLNGVADIDDYNAGVGPIRDHGYVIVNAHDHQHPNAVWCYRHEIEPGECFEYFNSPNQPHVAVTTVNDEPNVPTGWFVSSRRSACDSGRWSAKVKRLSRWDGATPLVRPCVDPLDRLLSTTVNGLTGAECLDRLERAMRTESVARVQGGFVSTLGEGEVGVIGGVVGGLDTQQFAHGQACWTAKVKKLKDAPPSASLPLEDQDELPNMSSE